MTWRIYTHSHMNESWYSLCTNRVCCLCAWHDVFSICTHSHMNESRYSLCANHAFYLCAWHDTFTHIHIWMSHVTHVSVLCNTWRSCDIFSHIHVWMSHVTHVNVLRHTYEGVVTYLHTCCASGDIRERTKEQYTINIDLESWVVLENKIWRFMGFAGTESP